jgi:PAS domain S-box-containing protein
MMHAVARAKQPDISQHPAKPSPSPWLLRSLFDAYPAAVGILDESGIILHTNQAWNLASKSSLVGPQYRVSLNYFDLCENIRGEPRRDAIALKEGILRVTRHEQEDFFFEYNTSEHSFEVHVTRLKLPGTAGNILVSHQTLAHARAESQTLFPEQFALSKAFHFVPQPMSLMTLVEGRYIDVNESFLAMLGFEREEVLGHTSLELGIWASPEERVRFVSRLNREGRINTTETRVRDKSGQLHVWLTSAELIETQSEKYLLLASCDITERRRMEQEISEVHGRLIRVQEEERCRIARELPDDINQKLALLSIELEQFSECPVNRPTEVRKCAKALWRRAHNLSSDIQRISYNLHPSKLDHLGLVAAVRSLCHEVSVHRALTVDFTSRDIPQEIPREVSLCIFRIAQEALRNVVRHSGSATAQVELVWSLNELNLRVTDSGSGFEPGKAKSKLGLGLISIQERLRLVGGELLIRSKPLHGTQVEARVPLRAPRS